MLLDQLIVDCERLPGNLFVMSWTPNKIILACQPEVDKH